MAKNKKRAQAPKVRNEAYMEGMMMLRHGNAAQPHKNKARYDRKSQNREWKRDV